MRSFWAKNRVSKTFTSQETKFWYLRLRAKVSVAPQGLRARRYRSSAYVILVLDGPKNNNTLSKILVQWVQPENPMQLESNFNKTLMLLCAMINTWYIFSNNSKNKRFRPKWRQYAPLKIQFRSFCTPYGALNFKNNECALRKTRASVLRKSAPYSKSAPKLNLKPRVT